MNRTQQVAQRFAKAQHAYEHEAIIQQYMADYLLNCLQQYAPAYLEKVLEIGCGSGLLSRQLLQRFSIQQLYLNDLNQTINFHQNQALTTQLHWFQGDIEQLTLPTSLNAIVSSAAVQWLSDLPQLWMRCAEALQPQGILALSSFATNNLAEIKQLTGQGLNYVPFELMQLQLQQAGFKVLFAQQQSHTLYFNNAMAVLKHLRATGVTATNANFRWTKALLQQFEQDYATLATSPGYPLTYEPIYIVARRSA